MSFSLQRLSECRPKADKATNCECRIDNCGDGKIFDVSTHECVPIDPNKVFINSKQNCFTEDTVRGVLKYAKQNSQEFVNDPVNREKSWGTPDQISTILNGPSTQPDINKSINTGAPGAVSISPRPAIILFHADQWCGPCKMFSPEWQSVCRCHKNERHNLYNTFEFDCSRKGSFKSEKNHYNVEGYPTLIWQSAGDSSNAKWQKYTGTRDEPSIRQFIFEKLDTMWSKPVREHPITASASVGDIRLFVLDTLIKLEPPVS